MQAKEYLDLISRSHSTYRHLKMCLKGGTSKEEFESLAKEVLENVLQDDEDYDKFCRTSGRVVPVEKAYYDLCKHSNLVLEFFSLYGKLNGF